MAKTNARKRLSTRSNGDHSETNGKAKPDTIADDTQSHKKQRLEEVPSETLADQFVPTKPLEINEDPDRVLFA